MRSVGPPTSASHEDIVAPAAPPTTGLLVNPTCDQRYVALLSRGDSTIPVFLHPMMS